MSDVGADTERDRYEIEGVAFIGRTFAEYARLFGLDGTGTPPPVTLDGLRVLDCPGGSCGFRAGAATRGADAWAVDPMYGPPVEVLAERGRRDVRRAMDGLDGVEHLYRWDYYDDRDDLEHRRWAALARFLTDYAARPVRYPAAALPRLPFPADTFDLTLSAHFLFTYADQFDHAFHRDALHELCRVTRGEVRVFPLVDLGTDRYDRLPALCDSLRAAGHRPHVEPVDFEFQRGACEVLVVETNQSEQG